MDPKKYQLSEEFLNQIKDIFGLEIVKGASKDIQNISQEGLNNAKIYLDRSKKRERLNLFEQSNYYNVLVDMQKLLGLKKTPRRMECYDISHLSGTFVYGSMVVFLDGLPAPKLYRLFKCPDRNNDYENHKEVLTRRLERYLKAEEGSKAQADWALPDLIIVDGGLGQLAKDWDVIKQYGLENQIEMVSLAKREERVFLVSDLE